MTDHLHNCYVPDTNKEVQGIYFQCFMHGKVYAKLDCLDRWIEDRERMMHFVPHGCASDRKKIASLVKTVTQTVGRQFNPSVNSTGTEARSGIGRGGSKEEHLHFLEG